MIILKTKEDCCGCEACVQVCHKSSITMSEDSEGFLYPKTNMLTCVDCGGCEEVCPVINQGNMRKPLNVYAAKDENEKNRINSSSGGIFTLFAEKILDRGGVVFGVKFDEQWNVIHSYAETKEELTAFRGSKYVQSRIGETFKQAKAFLKDGRPVLFTGTSCQIAGLLLFLKKDYPQLLTIDILCHGTPSPMVWRQYLKQEVKSKIKGESEISQIMFRDKINGWKNFHLTVSSRIGKKGTSIISSESLKRNLFMKGFLQNLYLRPACHVCPSRSLKSGSDVTLADYWGIEYVNPEFDDDKGVSLVLINSEKGNAAYSLLKTRSIETSYQDALKYNCCLEISVKIPNKRSVFFLNMEASMPFAQNIAKLTDVPLKQKIRSFLGRMKRKIIN